MKKVATASKLLMIALIPLLFIGPTMTTLMQGERWRFTLYCLTFSSPGQTEYRLVEIVKSQWAKIGVNLEIVTIDGSKFWSMIFAENRSYNPSTGEGWDLAMAQYTNYPYEPDLLATYSSPAAPWGPKSGINFATWKNGLADYWLNLAINEFDEGKRQQYFSEWQKEYVWDCPMIDLVSEAAPFPMRKDIAFIGPSGKDSFPGLSGFLPPLRLLKVEGKTNADYIEIKSTVGAGTLGGQDSQLPWFIWGGRERGYHWDGLIEYLYDDGEWKINPSLAESWVLNEDQKTITFNLRKGVTWHDGVKFNATDVIWSYNVMMDFGSLSARAGDLSAWINRVEMIDEYTVRFYMKKFAPQMFSACFDVSWTVICPWHIFKDVANKDILHSPESNWDKIVPGTGPFKLTEIAADKTYLVYEANPNYFNGVPMVDKLIVRLIQEPATALIALQKGELDIIVNSQYSMNFIDDLQNIESAYPNLKVRYLEGGAPPMQRCFYTNELNRYLSIRLVRRALVMATDREEIIRTIYAGHATVLATPVNPAMRYHDPNVTPLPYDPEQAKAILDSVGLEMPPEPYILIKDLPNPTTTYILPAVIVGLVVGVIVGYVVKKVTSR